MIAINLDNLLANRDMLDFQVILSSKKTPKEMVSDLRNARNTLLVYEIQRISFLPRLDYHNISLG